MDSKVPSHSGECGAETLMWKNICPVMCLSQWSSSELPALTAVGLVFTSVWKGKNDFFETDAIVGIRKVLYSCHSSFLVAILR